AESRPPRRCAQPRTALFWSAEPHAVITANAAAANVDLADISPPRVATTELGCKRTRAISTARPRGVVLPCDSVRQRDACDYDVGRSFITDTPRESPEHL